MLMLAQNGHHGSEYAQGQMNSLLPLIILNKKGDTKIDNSKLLLTMLISDPTRHEMMKFNSSVTSNTPCNHILALGQTKAITVFSILRKKERFFSRLKL